MTIKVPFIYTLVICILAIYTLLYFVGNSRKSPESFSTGKRHKLWLYWENKTANSRRPAYIDLCVETVKHHCAATFDVVELDEKTIFDWLPDVRRELDDKCSIPQKTDYYRYQLLYKYGGMWLDADIIVMRDLRPIIDKFAEGYEYV